MPLCRMPYFRRVRISVLEKGDQEKDANIVVGSKMLGAPHMTIDDETFGL